MMPQEGALVGQTLEGYRLRKLLGVGGMAEVYLAEEPSLGRDVAVKVLPRALATDPNYVSRFREEARHVANLRHPNIVPVYTFGEDRGLLYLVMPLLKESLRDRMEREGKLIPKEAGRIAYSIASALHTAHHYRVVHRDVKPENILIDADNKAMLTDFGIARDLDALIQGSAGRTLAATGLPVGTPEYMAPEQLRGVAATPQVDIYALGAVLYEMLSGRVPHDASTPYEVASAVMRDPIVPPSRYNPSVTPALERVILKAMSREPEDRYPDMRAFALDLRDALTGKTSTTNSLRWTNFVPASRGGPSALPSRPLDVESDMPGAPVAPVAGGTTKRSTLAIMSNLGRADAAIGAGAAAVAASALVGAGPGLAGGGRRDAPPGSWRDLRALRSLRSLPAVRSLWPVGERPTSLALAALAAVIIVALVGGGLTVSAISNMLANNAGGPQLTGKYHAATSPTPTITPTLTPIIVVITATPAPTTPPPPSPHTLIFSTTTVILTASYKSICQTQSPLLIENFTPQALTWRWASSNLPTSNGEQWKLNSGSWVNFSSGQSPRASLAAYTGASTVSSSQLSLRAYCGDAGTYSLVITDTTGRSYSLRISIQS